MTYIANSLTSANPAADLYTAMASAFTAAGFTLVDTQVISTRTHKVWKSAAGSNSQGLDWYLDVAYTTTGAGSVWLGAFEGYSSPNGLRGPYNANDSNPDETTYYTRFGATGSALETNWTHITNNIAQIATTTTAFAYWISITTDRVIAMTSTAPTSLAFCGFYEPYTPYANKAGALLHPLATCTVANPAATSFFAGNAQTAINRNPPAASSLGRSSRYSVVPTWNTVLGLGGPGMPVGYVDTGAKTSVIEGPRGAKIAFSVNWSISADDGSPACPGFVRDVLVLAGSGVTRGDTVTISGSTWVLGSLTTNRCFGFKAA